MALITYIRRAIEEDSEVIYDTHYNAIKYSCQYNYSKDVLNSWLKLLSKDDYIVNIKNKEFWVIEYNNEVKGFFQLDLQNTQLDALYIHPQYQNHGLGTALLYKAEYIASQNNLSYIKLFASLNSVSFYKLNNYHALGNYELKLDDNLSIECEFMRKYL